MKDVIKKVATLVEVRKLVTLLFAAAFVYLALTGGVNPTDVIAIFTMVFGYYFGRSTALDRADGGDGK